MNPRERLKRYRTKFKPVMPVAELARLLDCSHQMVYALESGTQDKIPGLLLAERIERLTKIPRSEWDRLAAVKHQRPRLKTA